MFFVRSLFWVGVLIFMLNGNHMMSQDSKANQTQPASFSSLPTQNLAVYSDEGSHGVSIDTLTKTDRAPYWRGP